MMESKTLRQILEELRLTEIVITPEGEIDFSDPATKQRLAEFQGENIKLGGLNLLCSNPDDGKINVICPSPNKPCEITNNCQCDGSDETTVKTGT